MMKFLMNMTADGFVTMEFIEAYVSKYFPSTKQPKGRRR